MDIHRTSRYFSRPTWQTLAECGRSAEECETHNRGNPCSNHLSAVLKRVQICPLHIGGHVCLHRVRSLIALSLNASTREVELVLE